MYLDKVDCLSSILLWFCQPWSHCFIGTPSATKDRNINFEVPQKYFVTSQSECNIFPIFGTSPLFIDLLSKMSCQMSRIHQYSGHCCFADSQGNAKDLYSYLSSNTSQFLAWKFKGKYLDQKCHRVKNGLVFMSSHAF